MGIDRLCTITYTSPAVKTRFLATLLNVFNIKVEPCKFLKKKKKGCIELFELAAQGCYTLYKYHWGASHYSSPIWVLKKSVPKSVWIRVYKDQKNGQEFFIHTITTSCISTIRQFIALIILYNCVNTQSKNKPLIWMMISNINNLQIHYYIVGKS